MKKKLRALDKRYTKRHNGKIKKIISSESKTTTTHRHFQISDIKNLLLTKKDKEKFQQLNDTIEKILVEIYNYNITSEKKQNELPVEEYKNDVLKISNKFQDEANIFILHALLLKIKELIGRYKVKIFKLKEAENLKELYKINHKKSLSPNHSINKFCKKSLNFTPIDIYEQTAPLNTVPKILKLKTPQGIKLCYRTILNELYSIKRTLIKSSKTIENIFICQKGIFENLSIDLCQREEYIKTLINDKFIQFLLKTNVYEEFNSKIKEITEDSNKNNSCMSRILDFIDNYLARTGEFPGSMIGDTEVDPEDIESCDLKNEIMEKNLADMYSDKGDEEENEYESVDNEENVRNDSFSESQQKNNQYQNDDIDINFKILNKDFEIKKLGFGNNKLPDSNYIINNNKGNTNNSVNSNSNNKSNSNNSNANSSHTGINIPNDIDELLKFISGDDKKSSKNKKKKNKGKKNKGKKIESDNQIIAEEEDLNIRKGIGGNIENKNESQLIEGEESKDMVVENYKNDINNNSFFSYDCKKKKAMFSENFLNKLQYSSNI